MTLEEKLSALVTHYDEHSELEDAIGDTFTTGSDDAIRKLFRNTFERSGCWACVAREKEVA